LKKALIPSVKNKYWSSLFALFFISAIFGKKFIRRQDTNRTQIQKNFEKKGTGKLGRKGPKVQDPEGDR